MIACVDFFFSLFFSPFCFSLSLCLNDEKTIVTMNMMMTMKNYEIDGLID